MKKKLAIALICVLLIGIVGGTLAYLTSQDSVTNTFTVGNVQINLDETEVDTEGKPVDPAARTEEGNEYHLLPGHTYTKDPTVTVLKGSEKSYVRMLVKVENLNDLKAAMPKEDYSTYYNGDIFLLQMLVSGWDDKVWVFANFDEATATYEFRYKEIVDASEAEVKLDALFDTITVPGEIDNDHLAHLANVKIVVTAHAIQADGMTDATDAWEKFSA